ncbi:MAG: hypothetical protein ACXACX_05960 [Candidatus Hodarchaeales archaeon]
MFLNEMVVACLPGSVFGRPVPEKTTRLAYVNFNSKRALEASVKISLNKQLPREFVEEYAPETLTAMRSIINWIFRNSKYITD